jgi:hypothetical protein
VFDASTLDELDRACHLATYLFDGQRRFYVRSVIAPAH